MSELMNFLDSSSSNASSSNDASVYAITLDSSGELHNITFLSSDEMEHNTWVDDEFGMLFISS